MSEPSATRKVGAGILGPLWSGRFTILRSVTDNQHSGHWRSE
jgi:hypothetical protein